MEEQSVNQRLNLIVNTFEKGKKAAFARKVGISPQGAQELLAGRKGDPSFKVLLKILESYPQVRTEWLVLGNGEMFTEPPYEDIKDGIVGEPGYWERIKGEDDVLYVTPKELEDAAGLQKRNIPSDISKKELTIMLIEAESDMMQLHLRFINASDFYHRVRQRLHEMNPPTQ